MVFNRKDNKNNQKTILIKKPPSPNFSHPSAPRLPIRPISPIRPIRPIPLICPPPRSFCPLLASFSSPSPLKSMSAEARKSPAQAPRPHRAAFVPARELQLATPFEKHEREKSARHYRTLFVKILATFAIEKRRKCGSSPPTTHDRDASPTSGVTDSRAISAGNSPPPRKSSYPPSKKPHRPSHTPPHHRQRTPRLTPHPPRLSKLPSRHLTTGRDSPPVHPRQPQKTRRIPRLRHITYRRIETVRGSTPSFMLLLDAHLARTYSPLIRDTRNFRRVCSTLYPILDPSGFLVIHLRLDPWSPYGCDTGHITRLTVTKTPPPESPPPVTVITIPVIDRIVPLLHTLIDDKKEKERILPLFSGTPCSAAQS